MLGGHPADLDLDLDLDRITARASSFVLPFLESFFRDQAFTIHLFGLC